MSLKVRDLCKSFIASFESTFIRFLASMDAEMFLKRRVLGKMFATYFDWAFIFNFLSRFLESSLFSSLVSDLGVQVDGRYGRFLLLCVHLYVTYLV